MANRIQHLKHEMYVCVRFGDVDAKTAPAGSDLQSDFNASNGVRIGRYFEMLPICKGDR